MESHRPAIISTDHRRMAISKLAPGHESAVELRNLLHGDCELASVSAKDLLEKVLRSFTETLSVLSSGECDEVSQNPATNRVSSTSLDEMMADSGESRKSPVSKDRRRGYKRRKTLETLTKITATPIQDGYSWRKYGQKEILHANYPRSYFRCTHKFDQGCQASKQVQRTQEDPPMYRTIYMGSHTCQDLLKAPQIILDPTPRESYLLNFESNMATKQDHYCFSSFPAIKQELKEEIQSDLNYLLSNQELRTVLDQSSGPTILLSSTAGSDHGEVASGVHSSCTASSHSLDFDNGDDCVNDFEAIFRYDEWNCCRLSTQ